MQRFLNLSVVLLVFLVFSCSSSHSSNDSDILPDADEDTQDSEIADNDSDSQNSEIADDSDEDAEPVYPDPVCIYIYEGREDSKLCFGPKKTHVKCKANPEENDYLTVIKSENSLGTVESTMDINDDFIFFALNPKDSSKCFDGETYCPNIYGCNRKDEYVYEIVKSSFIHLSFSVDGNIMVFEVWDAEKTYAGVSSYIKIFSADLRTNQISELTNWGSYGKIELFFPKAVFTDFISDHPIVLNLRTNTTKEISDLRCDDSPKIDNKYLVCQGRYSGEGLSKDELDETAWIVDLETYEVSPLSVLIYEGNLPYVSGDYAVFSSSRDTVYYGNFPGKLSGMEIYSVNLKTKREEKWTPDIKGIFEGNFTKPSFEYPFFSYIANETEQTSNGTIYVLNIETGKITKFWEKGQDWPYIKDRYVLVNGYSPNIIAKLPDLPKLPENADELCEDNNPCTDNRYFVTDGECHFIPNHERCGDDATTTFDICIDGECRGFSGTSTDEEMVTVEAGKFRYAGREYEIEKPFKMDVFEVTNGKYAECVAAKACVEPLRKRSLTVLNYYDNPFYENFPVLYINQFEAQNYCNWLGKRLPTEFEWMKATWDGEEKTYLWGEEEPQSETYPDSFYANTTWGYPGFVGWDVAEVGTFPMDKTVGGIMDMSGNVSEWTTSEWTSSLCKTPPCSGKFGGDLVVTKGGGYFNGGPELKIRRPTTPWSHSFSTGFRCVKDIAETRNKIMP